MPGCACVFGLSVACQSAHIAYAYAIAVVVGAVGTRLLDGSALLYGAVEADDIVVTYVLEASLEVPMAQGGSAYVAPLGGGAAMDDDVGDMSHGELIKNYELRIMSPLLGNS